MRTLHRVRTTGLRTTGLGTLAALALVLALGPSACAPDDDFLYELRFACDADHPCESGFVCGPAGVCVAEGSLPEVCNGADDDQNGAVDDGLAAEPCERTQGVCAGSVKPAALCLGLEGWDVCRAEDYAAHDAAYEPAEATCDGRDNDCDGVTDNLAPVATERQDGVCADAVFVCAEGAQEAVESYRLDADWEADETRCDRLDNDCDGETDELRATSLAECGACGFACPAAATRCVDGVCQDETAETCGYVLGPTDDADTAEMCRVPAGTYPVGEPGAGAADVALTAPLLVDRFEVTNGRYAAFLADQADPAPLLPVCSPAGERDWATPTPAFLTALQDHPVVCVTHAQAAAFCAWAGKRLPTPVEWEIAARGDGAGAWPWGDAAADGRANCIDALCNDVYPADTCAPVEGVRERCADTAPAFASDGEPTLPGGASPLGPLHMAGNAAEWVDDGSGGDRFELRGGSWDDDPDALRVWIAQQVTTPGHAKRTVGFRCVADWPTP